jgi:hypothetical protein
MRTILNILWLVLAGISDLAATPADVLVVAR